MHEPTDLDLDPHTRRCIGLIVRLQPKTIGEASAILGIPRDETADFLVRYEWAIEAAKVRHQRTGASRPYLAGRLVDKGLQRIQEELDNGNLDASEIPALLKPALAVLDQEQRRLAKLDEAEYARATAKDLPRIMIRTTDDEGRLCISITQISEMKRNADAVDVESRVLRDAAEGEI